MTSLGGPFLFRVNGLPDDWMLGAVRLGDRDIADTPWDVPTGGKEISGLQIVVTPKSDACRASSWTQPAGRPPRAPSCSLPTTAASGCPPRVSSAWPAPDADGRFSISGLPAGAYRAIARPFVEEGEWEDRNFLEAARDGGLKFELAAGGSETISVKLPPQGK
jgi:hypothetical protein